MSNLDRAKELKKKYKLLKGLIGWRKEYEPKVKQLKEKVEKGCGGEECKTGFKNRHVGTFCNKLVKCNECQETLEILNEILGEKKLNG